jgi:hypothetical protein
VAKAKALPKAFPAAQDREARAAIALNLPDPKRPDLDHSVDRHADAHLLFGDKMLS